MGGEIDAVINKVANAARADGKQVQILAREEELLTICRNSLQGASFCVAGVVFNSSPSEGYGGIWNYTLRADGALGAKIQVTQTNNDQELYALPLQHAIDAAIASSNSSAAESALRNVEEYPYTSLSQEERNTRIRVRYMGGIVQLLAVAFFIGVCGILYQQVGAQATERESQMAQLIECMMPNLRRWEPQFARLLSYHIAFSLLFLPGWIVMSIILSKGVFQQTSVGIVLGKISLSIIVST
jgi:ATP-binding cassette subfamily A (ABC1) protein 3